MSSMDKGLISRIYKELKKLNANRIVKLINGQMYKQFSEVQIANKYVKRCSISLARKEKQIKNEILSHPSQHGNH
jgi:hypothetical protein